MNRRLSEFISRVLFYGFVLPLMRVPIRESARFLSFMERQSLVARKASQVEYCNKIVSVACSESEFYKQRFPKHLLDPKSMVSVDDISRFPILEKSELRSVKPHEHCTPSSRIFSSRSTSGTTGQPVRVYLDRKKLAMELAGRKLTYQDYGIDLGSREARLWGRKDAKTWKGRLRDALLNRRVFDFSGASGFSSDEIEKIRSYKPDYLYGYSSLILKFAEMMSATGQQIPGLICIICTAENIFPHQKEFVEKVFGCPVYVEYGSSEVDVIASECRFGVLHVSMERVLLEAIPIAGEYSEVLVTDLHNMVSPLIRYRLGDAIRTEEKECSCGRASQVITEIMGRTQNQFVRMANGAAEHSVVFAYIFSELDEKGFFVKRFQVTQIQVNHFSIDVDIAQIGEFQKLKYFLVSKLKGRYGDEVRVDVRRNPDLVSNVGKFSYFVAMQ